MATHQIKDYASLLENIERGFCLSQRVKTKNNQKLHTRLQIKPEDFIYTLLLGIWLTLIAL